MAEKKDSMQELEERVMGEDDIPAPEDEYGNIHHPKKKLLTGALYTLALAAVLAATLALAAVLAAAAFFTKLFGA